jgi:RNA polymerase sigma-70 factor, ECF subfamily
MLENELRLVLEAVSGNPHSFERLAEHYSPTILGLVYTQVGDMEAARDITQETLLKAYTSLSTLQRPDRFGSWLRQIAVNLARTQLRTQSRRSQVSLDGEEAPVLAERGDAGVERTVERNMAKQEILRSLQAVPEGPRAALVMHYLVGLAPAEAAQRLGVSRAAFDTRLSRGRDMLRRELTRLMEETLTETRDEVAVYLAGIANRTKAALKEGQRERVSAAKELALLAARSNLPRLVRDLRAHDEMVRKDTARLMGDTLDRRCAEALMKALPVEAEAAVQAEICRSLARIGVTEAVPLLHKVSRNTADMTVHKAAAEAMKELQALGAATPAGNPDIPVSIDDLKAAGIEVLFLELLSDAGAPVRVHAADGLGRVESVKAIAKLVKLLAADPQDYVRRAAAEALGAVLWPGRTTKEKASPAQRSKAVLALAEALGDKSIGVQGEAGWSLYLINPPDVDLRRQVMERYWAVIEGALKHPGPWWVTFGPMLGALASEEDQCKVADLLFRDDVRWKGPLCGAMADMARPGRTAVNARIIAALQQGVDPRCNHNLVKALGKSLDPAALPFLLERLSAAHDANERTAVATAIAGYPEGRTLLKSALEAPDRDEAAALALVGALEPIATAEDVPFLEALAGRLSPRGAISARAAAKRITTR